MLANLSKAIDSMLKTMYQKMVSSEKHEDRGFFYTNQYS